MSGLPAGVGLGWRPQTARLVEREPGIVFTEVLAESVQPGHLPALEALADRRPVAVHGVSLGAGDAAGPDPDAVRRLAELAQRLRSPLVSEHAAFVRGDGRPLGHLFPLPRTRTVADRLAHHLRAVQQDLPAPLAVENVAALFGWPDDDLSEPAFYARILERSGCAMLFDVANAWAQARNHGGSLEAWLEVLPLERIACVHMAGGVWSGGLYHDTHRHPVGEGPLDWLGRLIEAAGPLPVLLERDGAFAGAGPLRAELAALRARVPEGPPRPVHRAPAPGEAPPDPALGPVQDALARTLLDAARVPAGFDVDRVSASARALARKRSLCDGTEGSG